MKISRPSAPWLPQRFESFYRPALFTILAFYLLNCFSPLRLEYDSVKYFALKECLEQACPPGFNPANDTRPYGYPLLLTLLSRIGLLHSYALALVNSCFLIGGLYFIKKLFQINIPTAHFFLPLLLNWTIIKFFNYPLAEMQYLFFSCGSLFFFNRYTQHRKIGMLLLALVLAGLSYITRTIGIALIAALLTGLAWEHRKEWSRHKRKIAILALIILSLLIAGIFFFPDTVFFPRYLLSLNGTGPGPVDLLQGHFKEWGQLLLNIPIGKFKGAGQWLFLLAGMLLFAWFCYGLFLQRTTFPFVIIIYLVSYCLIVFIWPYFDPRFWIPILPLVAVVLLQTPLVRARPAPVASFGRLLFIIYIFAGAGAIGYATYTAFHKEVLARSQANGRFRNEYETWFHGSPLSDTVTPVDPYVLHILKKYN